MLLIVATVFRYFVIESSVFKVSLGVYNMPTKEIARFPPPKKKMVGLKYVPRPTRQLSLIKG